MANTLLSIDWDFFFGNADDVDGVCGSCSWSGLCRKTYDEGDRPRLRFSTLYERVWLGPYLKARPSNLLCDLGVCNVPLYVAECHADIWPLLRPKSTVFNFDNHADASSVEHWVQRSGRGTKHWVRRPDKGTKLDGEALLELSGADAHCRLGSVMPPQATPLSCGNWATYAAKAFGIKYAFRFPVQEEPAGEHAWHYGRKLWRKWSAVFICQSRPWTPVACDKDFFAFLVDAYRYCGSITFLGPDQERLRRGFQRAAQRQLQQAA